MLAQGVCTCVGVHVHLCPRISLARISETQWGLRIVRGVDDAAGGAFARWCACCGRAAPCLCRGGRCVGSRPGCRLLCSLASVRPWLLPGGSGSVNVVLVCMRLVACMRGGGHRRAMVAVTRVLWGVRGARGSASGLLPTSLARLR